MELLHRIAKRNRQPELMDQPGLAAAEHGLALRGLARVNWFSRSAAIFWPTLRELAREQHGSPLRVLDVACGGGEVTVALVQRARREGVSLQMTGCDFSDTALVIARSHAEQANVEIEFFRHDVLKEPLPARFDVVICSLFLHHLDEPDAISVLRSMSQAGQAVLVNDLVRSRRGYLLAVIGTRLLSRSRIVHVDGHCRSREPSRRKKPCSFVCQPAYTEQRSRDAGRSGFCSLGDAHDGRLGRGGWSSVRPGLVPPTARRPFSESVPRPSRDCLHRPRAWRTLPFSVAARHH